MPELPEVETIRKDLLPLVKGKKIREVDICPDPKGCRLLRRYPSARSFARKLSGRKITALKRRAKYLLFYLDSGEILVIHLGMSGRLLLLGANTPLPSYTRAVFKLSGSAKLCLVDPRKFGEAYLFSEEEGHTRMNPFRLGPEPLGETFTPQKLEKILSRHNAAIKTVLLNQKAIAGLGNIYSDEALFRALIHPRRKSSGLSPAEIKKLYTAIRVVIKEAILFRGTTASDRQYVNGRGRAGRFQTRLNVYQRKGGNCPRCGAPIRTSKIGGRTAHFCPVCQKELPFPR